MPGEPETYPVMYIIFTLLNAVRRGIERKNIWREFRRQRIALKPRLSFWVAVCREAGLVREAPGSGFRIGWSPTSTALSAELRVTSYARAWLGKSPDEQAFRLIEAWRNAPKNRRVRLFRKKLLWKLKYDKPLTQKDLGALNGLEALGMAADGRLTKWGEFFIKREGKSASPKAAEPCSIQEEQFIASIPDHADLLWDLERYLRPKSPGVYPLQTRALQICDRDPHELIALIERGLGGLLPGQTKALILKRPSIRIADGFVLEFSSPVELQRLSRQPALRKYMDEFLSPRSVLVSHDKAKGLFQMLTRRGAHVYRNEDQISGGKKRTHFPRKAPFQPVGKSLPKLEVIETYRRVGQALEVWYRAPGYLAEQRRITPLLIEERGEYTYVIAYCQTRRARRTFRLDRMEIPGTY